MEVSPFVISEELSRLSVNDDFFAIDFAKVERKLAVEFNGPSHYTTSTMTVKMDKRNQSAHF